MSNLDRWGYFCFVLACAVGWALLYDQGGIKGQSIPPAHVVGAIIAAAVTTAVCRRFSRAIAPFAGGLAAAVPLADVSAGPYGVILGLLIGAAVSLWPSSIVSPVAAAQGEADTERV